MAVAHDAEADLSGDQTASATWTISGKTTAGSNRVGIVRFNYAATATLTGVTWNGSAMTEVPLSSVTSGSRTNKSFYIVDPPTASSDIVISFSAGTPAGEYLVTSYNEADTASPIGDVQTATGTSTTPSVDVTSASGDMVLDWMVIANTITSVGDSQTSEFIDTTGGSYRVGGSREAGAATVTMSWTVGSGAWGTSGFSINQAAAGGSSVPVKQHAYRTRRVS